MAPRASSTTSTSITPMPTKNSTRNKAAAPAAKAEPVVPFDARKLKESYSFPHDTIAEIQRMADEGLYYIRGFGAKRKLPTFDDLLFLGASATRYPLEGYRERCATNVTLGNRFAKKPIEL